METVMNNKILYLLCVTGVTSTLLFHAPSVTAQQKAEDKIKFRQSGMMFMRWNMGKIKNQVVKKPETYNKQQIIDAANVIAAVANSGIEKLFTTETGTGKGWKKTRVKPEYFKQPAKVKKLTLAFKKEASELARVSKTGDTHLIRAQFKVLLNSCKACHKDFRSKN